MDAEVAKPKKVETISWKSRRKFYRYGGYDLELICLLIIFP